LKKIFINRIGRRQFLKTSLSSFALATAYAYSTVHGANRSGRRAIGQLITSSALD